MSDGLLERVTRSRRPSKAAEATEALETMAAQLRLARTQALATVQQIEMALRLLGLPVRGLAPGMTTPPATAPERPAFNRRPAPSGADSPSPLLDSPPDAGGRDSFADRTVVTDPGHSTASVTHD